MKRLLPLLLTLLLLAACGGTTAVDEPAESPTTAPDSPTAVAESEAADEEKDPPAAEDVPLDGGELAQPIQPSTDPVVAGEIRARDWTKGADDPAVVIIEYGDFQ